jgi:hypothetical protein
MDVIQQLNAGQICKIFSQVLSESTGGVNSVYCAQYGCMYIFFSRSIMAESVVFIKFLLLANFPCFVFSCVCIHVFTRAYFMICLWAVE